MLASDPTFPLYPTFAFLGFILCLIPLPWHWQAWNSGTCAFMIWVGVFCLILGTNSVIWADNAINIAPVWCDISSQIITAAGVGIPASTLCITRRLYRITSTQTVSITRDDKRRAIYEDVAIVLGLPILVLILHIIVQGHRFDIVEEYGCSPTTYNTLPAYFIFYMWPILIGLVSFVYSSLTLRSFYMRRIQFSQLLSSNNAINPSRYLRLMSLALIDIMCTVPIGIYLIYLELDGVGLQPWISWANTHFDFSHVVLVPSVIWRSDPSLVIGVQLNRWVPVACAFIFFALFGFAEEAQKNYRRAFWFFARRLGFRPASEGGGKTKGGILSGLKNFKLKPDDGDSLPVYVIPTGSGPAIPSARKAVLRQSMLDAESRSTIYFPDDGDDVELSPYRNRHSTRSVAPSSPSSSSSCSPTTPVTPTMAPPSYVDSAHLDAMALALKREDSHPHSPSAFSFTTLPSMQDINDSGHLTRPSSYSCPSMVSFSRQEQNDENPVHDHDDVDGISITDAYPDSCSPSPIQVHHPQLSTVTTRLPTLMPPFIASQTPVSQPQTLAFHRPFSPPTIYPTTQSHLSRNPNASNSNSNGILVTVHSQSSRETL